jgi:AraC-like DNA-binding protein
MSILDAVHQLGYSDQPHLTRALKRLTGHTPAQVIGSRLPVGHSVQDNALLPGYPESVQTDPR